MSEPDNATSFGFLPDSDLRYCVQQKWITNCDLDAESDWTSSHSQIQASSIDLFPAAFLQHGSQDRLDAVSLPPGAAVLIETREVFDLPEDVMGLVFTPTSWSLQGFFSTSVGHIDPGYNKSLTIVGINMGGKTLELDCSKKIAQVLLYRLHKRSEAPYCARRSRQHLPRRTTNIINNFAVDFGDFRNQAKAAAQEVARQVGWETLTLFVTSASIAAILAVLLNLIVGFAMGYAGLGREVSAIQQRVATLEAHQNVAPAPAHLVQPQPTRRP